MHPTSVFKYFSGNKKRFAIVILAILLGVFLLYSLSVVIKSIETAYTRSSLEPMKHFSILSASSNYLSGNTVEYVRNQEFVERIIPLVIYNISLRMSIGGFTGTSLYIVDPDDIPYLMDLMGLRLAEGRIPDPGSLETILNRDVAQNLGVGIGDRIGSGMDNDVRFPEQYKVVGIIEGRSLVSFASLLIDDAERYNILAIPKEGRQKDLEHCLRMLQSPQMSARTYSTEYQTLNDTLKSINLLITAVGITVVIIISACIGFLCYIYYMQRQNEYGLLRAIGYTSREIIRRTFTEIGIMNLAGFVSGIALSVVAVLIMKLLVFRQYGQTVYAFDADALLKAACVPIFTTIFSLGPVWRLMKKTDPVRIMD